LFFVKALIFVLCNVNYHVVWSVKYRRQIISPEIEQFLKETAFHIAEDKGFTLHLFENLLVLLETYENFHVIFTNSASEDHYMVYVKEDFGAIVAKTTSPPVILSIGENNLKAAFWDYLISLTSNESTGPRVRDESHKKLADHIARLKGCSVSPKAASAV